MGIYAVPLFLVFVAGLIGTHADFGPGATIFSWFFLIGGAVGLVCTVLEWIVLASWGDSKLTIWSDKRLEKARKSKSYLDGVTSETTYHSDH